MLGSYHLKYSSLRLRSLFLYIPFLYFTLFFISLLPTHPPPLILLYLYIHIHPPFIYIHIYFIHISSAFTCVQFMANAEPKILQNPPTKTHKFLLLLQIFLRASVMAASLASTSLIVTNKETTLVFGIPVQAKYSYSPSFK